MKKFLLLPLIIVIFNFISAHENVLMYEKQVTLPTYEVAPPEKSLIFFRDEAFQGGDTSTLTWKNRR